MPKRYSLPDWEARRLAEAPGISQMLFVYDTLEADITLIGAALPSLEHVQFLPSRPTLRSDRFSIEWPPLPQGWVEFGMFGPRPGSEVEIGSLQMEAVAWFFFVQWNPTRSAWQALLAGQDALRPQKTSLTPEFVLPSMFLGRMAHFPLERSVQGVATNWVACFAQAQTRLLPLITGLYREWMTGPSGAARRYRQLARSPLLALQPEQEEAISLWREVFGDAFLDQVRSAERLEPTIMRGLEAASTRLWTDAPLTLGHQQMQFIAALLPITQWQSHPPGPTRLDPESIASLEALRQEWDRWRGHQ